MTALRVISSGPGVSVQDLGRAGYLGFGLSRGGAADRLALAEGTALLGQPNDLAALEMAGFGGEFEASEDIWIALTGAPMRARIGDAPALWNASHCLPKGARLSIGAAERGSYGYLHVAGGIATPPILEARSVHLAAGLGSAVQAGDVLRIGATSNSVLTAQKIAGQDRFSGGTVRFVPGPQTGFFGRAELDRFQNTAFTRDMRGNRMGARFNGEGAGFHSEAGLSVLSEVIVPGDIQVTGEGAPFVLLSECQTTGGYPRIGSVLPCDLPLVAQCRPGDPLRFQMVSTEEGAEIERHASKAWNRLAQNVTPLVRDPREMSDLLSYQLIDGMTAGDELERGPK